MKLLSTILLGICFSLGSFAALAQSAPANKMKEAATDASLKQVNTQQVKLNKDVQNRVNKDMLRANESKTKMHTQTQKVRTGGIKPEINAKDLVARKNELTDQRAALVKQKASTSNAMKAKEIGRKIELIDEKINKLKSQMPVKQ